MPQENGWMANQVEGVKGFCCEVCGASPVTWTWGDVHGEAMCVRCGTPYQILQYEKDENGNERRADKPPRLNVKSNWIPVLQQYWQETQQFMGLAAIMIARDYPECVEGHRKFNDWLKEHPEVMPSREG